MAITQGISTKVGSGSDTLMLKITQDAYQGDSQYAVFVDGKQIGGTFTAKALHNSGQYDTLEIKGDWGRGQPHGWRGAPLNDPLRRHNHHRPQRLRRECNLQRLSRDRQLPVRPWSSYAELYGC
jgi:hypothetical protein